MKTLTMGQALSLSIMPLLLSIAFYSFFAGLVVYVWNIHTTAGHCVLAFILIFYLWLSITGDGDRRLFRDLGIASAGKPFGPSLPMQCAANGARVTFEERTNVQ